VGNSVSSGHPASGRMQRLDGVRALAVMLVLGEHFWWHTTLWLGAEGIILFFVLSGFLITSILLDYSDELSIGEAARVFYLKRLLRLTPVYYVCIGVTVLLGIGGTRQTWWVDALYLTNFRVVLRQSWGPDTHFWTLAVEEQFYLLWLPIVMLLPRRRLLAAILSLLVIGPVFRWAMGLVSRDAFEIVLLPGSVDFLGAGALLAYVNRYCSDHPTWLKFKRWRMPLLLLLTVEVVTWQIVNVFSLVTYSLLCACLVSAAAESAPDWRLDWLGGRAIRHLGIISYSVYVWHFFIPQLLGPLRFLDWTKDDDVNRLTHFAVLSCISIGIAEVSWRLIEKPMNSLRARIVPRPERPVSVTTPGIVGITAP
jgi:peptidoglycan/LPS O-acetylase OafA/YrhL